MGLAAMTDEDLVPCEIAHVEWYPVLFPVTKSDECCGVWSENAHRVPRDIMLRYFHAYCEFLAAHQALAGAVGENENGCWADEWNTDAAKRDLGIE